MQSSNPILSRKDAFTTTSAAGYATFRDREVEELEQSYAAPAFERMTIDDVVMRTGTLLGILFVTGAAAWVLDVPPSVAILSALIGLGLVLFLSFSRKIRPGFVIAYAAVEGVFIGAVSHWFEDMYEGIVVQAAGGTVFAFAGMLYAYKSGRIRVTPRFTKMVVGGIFAFLGLAVMNFVASFFMDGGLGLRDGGMLAILFSVAAIVLATLSFALDFDFIEKAIAQGAPREQSWVAAFGLVVGLVWLYIELLRLISYFRD